MDAYENALLPYLNAGQLIFSGMRGLLDDQVEPERRPAALVRLKRYSGLEPGYTPTTVLAENLFREKLKTRGLLGPLKEQARPERFKRRTISALLPKEMSFTHS